MPIVNHLLKTLKASNNFNFDRLRYIAMWWFWCLTKKKTRNFCFALSITSWYCRDDGFTICTLLQFLFILCPFYTYKWTKFKYKTLDDIIAYIRHASKNAWHTKFCKISSSYTHTHSKQKRENRQKGCKFCIYKTHKHTYVTWTNIDDLFVLFYFMF